MQTKIEGLLISKLPYQERHLIGDVLLRSGRKISVLFYGGRGGGKKQKSSTLELGHMLKIELRPSKKTSNLHYGKEWLPVWMHSQIRLNHKAFYLGCFFLEVINKLSPEDDLHDQFSNEDESFSGLFRVLSNAFFHLERSLPDKFNILDQLFVFLGKTLVEQGVFPERNQCALSGVDLDMGMDMVLSSEQGGFVASQCLNDEERRFWEGNRMGSEMWSLLGQVAHVKYSELQEFGISDSSLVRTLLQYLLYQFQWQEKDFKTLSMVL